MASHVLQSFGEAFATLLRPLAQFMFQHEFFSWQVSVMRIFFFILVGIALSMMADYPAIFIFVPIAMVLGMAMRSLENILYFDHETKRSAIKAAGNPKAVYSPLGVFLQEFGAIVSDVALYAPFALLFEVSPVLVITTLLLIILSEVAGIIPLVFGASRRKDGPLNHSDRAFIMALVGLSLGVGAPTWMWVNIVFAGLGIMSLWTMFHRAFYALREYEETQTAVSSPLPDKEFDSESNFRSRIKR